MREILSTRVNPGHLTSLGLEEIKVTLYQDGVEQAHEIWNTGCPGAQNFRTMAQAVSGENEPCPEGYFTPGPVEWAGRRGDVKTLWEKVGSPIWIDIYTPRAIGAHLDGNRYDPSGRVYSPGSAGCEVAPTLESLLKVAGWWDAGPIQRWTNDWGLGTVHRPEVLHGIYHKIFLNDNKTNAYSAGKPVEDLDLHVQKTKAGLHISLNGKEIPASTVNLVVEQKR